MATSGAIVAAMELLFLALFFGGFMALFFGLGAWSWYFQPKRDGEKWAAAAAALGLALEPRTSAHRIMLYSSGPTIKQRMIGQRGGVPIRVGIRIEVRGSGKSRRTYYFTYAEAALPRSLELGLSVAPTQWLVGVLSGLMGDSDLSIGNPRLDDRYRIKAAVGDQARALLSAPYVMDALIGLGSAPFRPYLDDTTVRMEAGAKYLRPSELQMAIDQAVDLAHRIVSARTSIGPSAMQRVVAERWSQIAQACGLALDVERCAMGGRCEGMHVEVQARQSGEQYGTTFSVYFDRPLGMGLKLERQGALSGLGALLGMQDIRTGDATFDDRFVVKGMPEASVRAALTPFVRQTLIALQEQASQLVVEDNFLRAEVGWLVTEPEWLHAGITTIARAGAALTGTTAQGVGPYRV